MFEPAILVQETSTQPQCHKDTGNRDDLKLTPIHASADSLNSLKAPFYLGKTPLSYLKKSETKLNALQLILS